MTVTASTDRNRLFDGNPYYSPEACGLKLIDSLEDEYAGYSFTMLIVVQDIATGDLYADYDSGCSCPTPFEDTRSLADMTPIKTLDDLKTFVHSFGCPGWLAPQRQALYRKVRRALAS